MKNYKSFINPLLEKYIKSEQEVFDDNVRQILRTYGSIPIDKHSASDILQRIIYSEVNYSKNPSHPSKYERPVLGEDVDFNLMKSSNKVRIYEYLKTIIKTKTIRGDSFEGLISGLYKGELSNSKSSKYDVIIDNKKISIKFLNTLEERPVLGNIKSDVISFFKAKKSDLKYTPLNDLLKQIGEDDSFYILNDIAFSDVDYFLFGYPIDKDIKCVMISRENLIKRYIYESDIRYAPKQKGSYQIRVNVSKLLKNTEVDQYWKLISPTITEKDLKYLSVDNAENTADKLFGTDKNRIRGSILNSIIKFGEFKDINDKEYFVFDFEEYKNQRGH